MGDADRRVGRRTVMVYRFVRYRHRRDRGVGAAANGRVGTQASSA